MKDEKIERLFRRVEKTLIVILITSLVLWITYHFITLMP